MISPYTRTEILSARSKTTPISCSTIKRVLFFEISLINFVALSVSLFDIPAVGSSNNIVSAPPAIVIPISVLVYGEIICSDKPKNVKNNKIVKEAYLGAYGN
jgi:hypothetical protein